MRSAVRQFVQFLAAGLALLVFGFLIFAVSATHEARIGGRTADAIVVLTGAGNRIEVAGQLLTKGFGRKLLISGVNRRVGFQHIRRISGLSREQIQCCVEIGYEAQDTIGNAYETKQWVARTGVRRLIVVTSSYHMLRSLTELRSVLPETELIPFPVVPAALKEKPWWLSLSLTRTLASEYLKLLPAAARFAAARLFQPLMAMPTSTNIDNHSR